MDRVSMLVNRRDSRGAAQNMITQHAHVLLLCYWYLICNHELMKSHAISWTSVSQWNFRFHRKRPRPTHGRGMQSLHGEHRASVTSPRDTPNRHSEHRPQPISGRWLCGSVELRPIWRSIRSTKVEPQRIACLLQKAIVTSKSPKHSKTLLFSNLILTYISL